MAVTLSKGYKALALHLQEAGMFHSDVQARLADTLRDMARESGQWCYYVTHDGDGETGDVIYSCDGDMCKAPYVISDVDGKAACTIDMSAAVDVVPMTTYEEEADDEDFGTMEESYKRDGLYASLPAYERLISKGERDKADQADFAGKGKSYPILKAGDVMAAVHSMGRAGSSNDSSSGLKANIIKIAKRKGFGKMLPKSWQSGADAKESVTPPASNGNTIKLKESVAFSVDIPLSEAFKPSYQIKLISPGKGSSAIYPAEVLKRDGPKVFKAGTPMRIDHPTQAEESARPEGSVKDWGAVLAKDAYWLDDHPKGPGLYSEVKPFSDHVQTIDEKGPYAGVSIRANGNALVEGGKVVMQDGLPVLAGFTSAEGVDMVTRAGAGGLFLQESARDAATKEPEMDQAAVQQLIEAANAPLIERAIKAEAREEGARILESVSLPAAAKTRVLNDVISAGVPRTANAIDMVKFTEALNGRAKTEAEYLSQIAPHRVTGFGAAPVQIDAQEAERREKAVKLEEAENLEVFSRLIGGEDEISKKAALMAARGRAA